MRSYLKFSTACRKMLQILSVVVALFLFLAPCFFAIASRSCSSDQFDMSSSSFFSSRLSLYRSAFNRSRNINSTEFRQIFLDLVGTMRGRFIPKIWIAIPILQKFESTSRIWDRMCRALGTNCDEFLTLFFMTHNLRVIS